MLHETEKQYRKLLTNLEPREQRFVSEYLIDCNAARASRAAGYSQRSDRTIGWENLTKPHIEATVRAGLNMIATRCEVSAEKVMREVAAIAFSNYLHYEVTEDGTLVVAEGAPAEAALAIARTKHKRHAKEDGTVVTESEFTLWDKIAALTLLGKKLRLWVEKVEVDNPQDEAYRLLLKQLKEGTGDHK